MVQSMDHLIRFLFQGEQKTMLMKLYKPFDVESEMEVSSSMSSITNEANAFMYWLIEEELERQRMSDPDYQAAMKEIEEMLRDSRKDWEKRIRVSII